MAFVERDVHFQAIVTGFVPDSYQLITPRSYPIHVHSIEYLLCALFSTRLILIPRI